MDPETQDREERQGRIRELLRRRHALLLVHNYQRPEIQDLADMCGDSLELSMRASQTDADVIVFCGVHFMAETAAVLCPDKQVILPVAEAGCPMADMITAEALRRKRREIPDALVISYVNTTADVKAESDICCTSANSVQVALSVPADRRILMTPDRNLARYTISRTGRDISYWDGFCPVHERLTPERVEEGKRAHPHALFLAHPECRPEVLALADAVKSTSGMIAYAGDSDAEAFIIGTETGILYPLSKAYPEKSFVPADPAMICRDMKRTGLDELLHALETMGPVVRVPDDVSDRARQAVERMLAVPKG